MSTSFDEAVKLRGFLARVDLGPDRRFNDARPARAISLVRYFPSRRQCSVMSRGCSTRDRLGLRQRKDVKMHRASCSTTGVLTSHMRSGCGGAGLYMQTKGVWRRGGAALILPDPSRKGRPNFQCSK